MIRWVAFANCTGVAGRDAEGQKLALAALGKGATDPCWKDPSIVIATITTIV
jgi:hypothetical protein